MGEAQGVGVNGEGERCALVGSGHGPRRWTWVGIDGAYENDEDEVSAGCGRRDLRAERGNACEET